VTDVDYIVHVGLFTARLLLLDDHPLYKRLTEAGAEWTSVVGVNGVIGK
jgi:hypothetical protein